MSVEKDEETAFSKSVTEISNAFSRFSSLLESRIREAQRGREKGTLWLSCGKRARLWLLLISGFVCAASGSSSGFAGRPAGLLSHQQRWGFLPGACSDPLARGFSSTSPTRDLATGSQMTGNAAITGTPLFVYPSATDAALDHQISMRIKNYAKYTCQN